MPSVDIINSDTSTNWSPVGDIALNDNSLVEYVVGPDSKSVIVNCKVQDGYQTKLYEAEYQCALAHSSITVSPIGAPLSIDFTHYDVVMVEENGVQTPALVATDTPADPDGYWVSAINGVKALQGCLDIVGGDRLRWKPLQNGIAITDMSRPSVDCIDYVRLAGYITKLDEVMTEMARQLAAVPAGSGSAKTYGLFKQYQAMRELWNYLVIRNMVVFNTLFQGDTAYVQAKLTNNTGVNLYVGDMTIGFPSSGLTPGSGYFSLDMIWSGHSVRFSDTGIATGWQMTSAERQSLADSSFKLEAPASQTVRPGESCEIQSRFKISATISPSDPIQTDVQHRDTPWAGQWPVISNGYVTKPGHLSYFNPHFNPSSYPTPVPADLPPAGDGCTMRMAPGTATTAWVAAGLARCVLRPELYIGLTCTADSLSSDLTSNFTAEVECSDNSEGTYSLSLTATTCTLMFTPTGQSAFAVLVITVTNRHFHEGDGICVALPKGWSSALASVIGSGVNVPTQLTWELPASSLLPSASEAGGTKLLAIPPEAGQMASMMKRIKLDSQMYKIDSVRGIEVWGSIEEDLT